MSTPKRHWAQIPESELQQIVNEHDARLNLIRHWKQVPGNELQRIINERDDSDIIRLLNE